MKLVSSMAVVLIHAVEMGKLYLINPTKKDIERNCLYLKGKTMLNEKTKKRCDQLCKLGLIFNGQEYIKDDFNVHWTEITCDTDEEFNKKIASIEKEMERRNEESASSDNKIL